MRDVIDSAGNWRSPVSGRALLARPWSYMDWQLCALDGFAQYTLLILARSEGVYTVGIGAWQGSGGTGPG